MSAARPSTWCHWLSSWRHSLGFRIVAVILAVSLLLAVVAGVYDYRVEEESARQDLLDHGRSVTRQAALACPDAVINLDTGTLRGYVADLVVDDKYVSYAIVRRADGKDLAAFPEAASTAEGDPTTLVVAEPIFRERGGPRLGTFVSGLSLRPMQEKLRTRMTMMLVRSGCGFLLLAWLLWLALRQVVVKPLRALDGEAQRLGRGELAQPLPAFGTTELGRLGRTLDEMRNSLRTSHESLAQQNRQLVELDRLKSQFLANMSHEIRTPLTSILGGVEMLAEAGTNEQERQHSVSALQRNGEQLLELVDRLLDLAKLETGNLLVEQRPCRPDEVLAAVCERFRATLNQAAVGLHLDTQAIVGRSVVTDPTRLRQVLASVVGNAVKFTSKGSVDVQARLDESVQPPTLRVVVADTGVGIPPEFLPRVFEPFNQADGSLTRRHGGTGMGLAMARKIARQLGGDVTVQSEVGRGTRVEITIAVAIPATPSMPAASATKAAAPKLSGRVLVVDDALDNQRLLKAMLQKAGLSVELAANGCEAVDAVQKTVGASPFGLVLMDLQMPELDGVSAIRALRTQGFDLPIVALTAHALAEDRQRCLEAGADDYETKPITRQRLLEVVSRHLRPSTG